MKTLSLILFFLCISFSALHAQSLRDSISLEFVSFEDPKNVGHYTHVCVAIENHTKDFRYCLFPERVPELGKYWRFTFEVEYTDGRRSETNTCSVFEISDMEKMFLLPGERRVSVLPLFATLPYELDTAVFTIKGTYRRPDVMRLRFFNRRAVMREASNGNVSFLLGYGEGVVSSDWYDLTTPDFDFLRK